MREMVLDEPVKVCDLEVCKEKERTFVVVWYNDGECAQPLKYALREGRAGLIAELIIRDQLNIAAITTTQLEFECVKKHVDELRRLQQPAAKSAAAKQLRADAMAWWRAGDTRKFSSLLARARAMDRE